ncbi:putative RDD family membrane protein YckC [Evansella vedderi]|uniref:RDD family membrane protein YckC n=1 Tax=Evansella vedderi TaxID=38282 RepID=A0ABT9ZUV2_9BACI|nr:RDD family protein [Evansella vedderi]MDQ0255021.1 putative RDD family membrane protein YckC [Evansella vedderi]
MNESNTSLNEEQIQMDRDDSTIDSREKRVPAGFWMRFWAYIIDLIIVASINGILLTPFLLWTNMGELTLGVYSLGAFVSTIISFGYFVLTTKRWNQTLGKRIMGIKVCSDKKVGLSWQDVLMREVVGRYIHQSLVITNALYIIVPFHPRKKGLHDILGDTHVILEEREKV